MGIEVTTRVDEAHQSRVIGGRIAVVNVVRFGEQSVTRCGTQVRDDGGRIGNGEVSTFNQTSSFDDVGQSTDVRAQVREQSLGPLEDLVADVDAGGTRKLVNNDTRITRLPSGNQVLGLGLISNVDEERTARITVSRGAGSARENLRSLSGEIDTVVLFSGLDGPQDRDLVVQQVYGQTVSLDVEGGTNHLFAVHRNNQGTARDAHNVSRGARQIGRIGER